MPGETLAKQKTDKRNTQLENNDSLDDSTSFLTEESSPPLSSTLINSGITKIPVKEKKEKCCKYIQCYFKSSNHQNLKKHEGMKSKHRDMTMNNEKSIK